MKFTGMLRKAPHTPAGKSPPGDEYGDIRLPTVCIILFCNILQVVKCGYEPQPVPSSQWACFPLVSAKDDERWRPSRIPQRTDGTLRETCLPATLNGNITKHAWKICETLKCSGNDRNYRNCNCFSCCNSKTTTTDVAAFCCTCSCHLQLTIPPTTSSLHHHSFCCFCELTYSHRKWKREFEESGLPGFGYESCSHESYSKQDMRYVAIRHRIFRELRAPPSCSAGTAWSTNSNPKWSKHPTGCTAVHGEWKHDAPLGAETATCGRWAPFVIRPQKRCQATGDQRRSMNHRFVWWLFMMVYGTRSLWESPHSHVLERRENMFN